METGPALIWVFRNAHLDNLDATLGVPGCDNHLDLGSMGDLCSGHQWEDPGVDPQVPDIGHHILGHVAGLGTDHHNGDHHIGGLLVDRLRTWYHVTDCGHPTCHSSENTDYPGDGMGSVSLRFPCCLL